MKIIAVAGGVGLAAGGALIVVLRFLAGPSVRDAVGSSGAWGSSGAVGMPRRYVDYLTTSQAAGGGLLHLLPVALGAGLMAGLLAGTVLHVLGTRARSAIGRWTVVFGLPLVGLVVGVLLAVELRAYGASTTPDDFGWYAYSPLSSGAVGRGSTFGFVADPSVPGAWWPLLLTGAWVGLLVGVLAAGVAMCSARPRGRRRRVRGSTSPNG